MQARHLLSPVIPLLLVLALSTTVSVPAVAQEATATVPRLITFSGTLGPAATVAGENGVVLAPGTTPTKVVAVTFSLYSDETGGAPLWSEVQNVNLDGAGHYTVQLGASKPDGLPMDIFASVQAHWLGVQPQGQAEQPRVLLVSVPYALKSADAETFGGLPPSAYQLVPSQGTNQTTANGAGSGTSGSGTSGTDSTTSKPPGFGAPGYLPLWTTFTTLGNSVIYQQLATGKIGIGTMAPKSAFDVSDNNSSTYSAINGTTTNFNEVGVSGQNLNTDGGVGVGGHVKGSTGIGVFGVHDNTTGKGSGVTGLTNSGNGIGVFGGANTPTGTATGVAGASASVDGVGVAGVVTAAGGEGHATRGVQGQAQDPNGAGGFFANTASTGQAFGVAGTSSATNGKGVFGLGVDSSKIGEKYKNLSSAGVWGDNGNGPGVFATADDTVALLVANNSSTTPAIIAFNEATSGQSFGISGTTNSTGQNASGLWGIANPDTGATNGVWGETHSSDGNADGVYGLASSTSGGATGVTGVSEGVNGYGVWGKANSTDTGGFAIGVYGQSNTGDGVYGTSTDNSGVVGMAGYTNLDCCTNAVAGINVATSGHNNGVYGESDSGLGVGGIFENTAGGLILLGRVNPETNLFTVDGNGNVFLNGTLQTGGGSTFGGAVQINGNLNVTGTLTKGGGSFKIDDPLDPANKYLSHSFVESPDMMNIYNGVVRLDGHGEAWVVLPAYFDALNRDFRYQLTSLGSPQPRLYIAREVNGNRFKISGGRANGKVSWQVTGVRQDAWANAHRIPNEEDKLEKRGTYLHPELYRDKSSENTNAMLQH